MNRNLLNAIDQAQETRDKQKLESHAKQPPALQDSLFELPPRRPKERKPIDTSKLPKGTPNPDAHPFVCRGKDCGQTIVHGYSSLGNSAVLNFDGPFKNVIHHAVCPNRDDFSRRKT